MERLQILWNARTKHGDIGILVKIMYRDGGVLEGVGFLEAKKRFPRKLTFDSLNLPQLSKLAKISPRTNLLLYDYEDITGFVSSSSVPLGLLKEQEVSQGLVLKPVTNALVVQTGVVLETKAKDLTLYKYGVPFSHQLILRYMQGLDLDHRQNVVDSVKGFNNKHGYCTYLLKVTISHGNAGIQDNKTEINGNIYKEIET